MVEQIQGLLLNSQEKFMKGVTRGEKWREAQLKAFSKGIVEMTP